MAGMQSWWRSWHGAPTDMKWLAVARRAGVAPGMVAAIAWALLDHASQAEDRGSVAEFDVDVYAAFSGFGEDEVAAVIRAMHDKGIITEEDRLASWEKRQPQREDSSAQRVAVHRARRVAGDVTRCDAAGDDVTHCNAVDDDVTQCDAPEREKRREEENREEENREEAEESRVDGADAPGALPPAARAFEANGGCWPEGKGAEVKRAEAIRAMAETVGESPGDVERWGQVVRAYCRQWSSLSWGTMLEDYFAKGRMPGESERRGVRKGRRACEEMTQGQRPPPGFVSVDGVLMLEEVARGA